MSTPGDLTHKLNSSFTLNDNRPTVASDETQASIEAVDVLKYVALVLISLLNILGNTSVCIVVAKNRRLRNAVRNLAIASLACADLMMVPFFLYTLAKISHRTVHDACVFFVSFLIMSLYTSILHLFVLCVDTYVAVFYPLRYRTIVTRNRIAYALLLVWVLPVLNVLILPLSIDAFQASEYRSRMFLCGRYHSGPQPPPTPLYRIHSLATGTIFAALPFVLIVAAYARIAKAAWYQASRDRVDMAGNSNTRMRGNIRRMRELKWAKTVVIVISAFMCCYVPLFLVAAVSLRLRGSNTVIEKLLAAFAYLAYTNTCLNPLIYSFRSSEYRTGLRNLFYRLKGRFWEERERRPRPLRECSTANARQRVKCRTTNGNSSKDNLNLSCSSSSQSDEVSPINRSEIESKM